MLTQKLFLSALAVGSVVTAQSAICSQATATVNSQADATALADCPTISGSLLISSTASGVISLDGPQQITGDLIAMNAGQLTSLTSSTIGSIGGTFNLNNMTLLSTLQFSVLQVVESISWIALPALPQLSFTATISQATSVLITNTFLSTLDGINLATVATLNINNNNRLKTFSTQVANITQLLNIDSNGRSLDVSFPNLIWAANMTFRNCSSISMPSLATVNGSLGFYENFMTNVIAPNLTSTGKDLAFVANPDFANLSMPLLQSVGGGVLIANNSDLDGIGFPSLTFVGGAIDLSGNFTTPSLPALNDVKGGFNMQSTANIDCSGFESEHTSGLIQGVFTCKTTANAQSGTGTGTSTSSSASPTKTKGAAGQLSVNAGSVIGLSVIGGLMQMLL